MEERLYTDERKCAHRTENHGCRQRGRSTNGALWSRTVTLPTSIGKLTRRSEVSSATTEPNTCAKKPGVPREMANYCCRGSHGAEDAVTRCTPATRMAPSTSAIT